MLCAGLDIGTTGCKIVLYDEEGNHVRTSYREYEISRNKGLHEIDGTAIFDAVKHVIREADLREAVSIAVTSFGESFVMLDKEDRPLLPTMLYTDPRGGAECADLVKAFGDRELALRTGTKMHEMYSLPKVLWIKKNMPDKYEQAKCILLIQDYIVYMLSGVRQIDYSLAARTAVFDIKNKCWMDEVLKWCGVDKRLFSTPVPSGTIAGKVKGDIASGLGINREAVIVSGCHDQIAAMTGANVFEEHQVMDGTGTVECVPVIMDTPPTEYGIYEKGYSIAPHVNGKYACYVLSYAGGATLKWFRDNFSDKSYDELNLLVKDEVSDLMIMPHFAGAATPYMNSSSTAAILGLTFEHGKMDLYKALMEGTAYEIMLNLEVLKEYGIVPQRLIATGGGARSDVWLQIKADVLGLPVTALSGDEVGAAGSAYLGGKALAIYDEDTRLLSKRKTFYPNQAKHESYRRQFKKYKKIYQLVMEVMKEDTVC